MQRVMQNNAAVFRTQETLAEGIYCAFSLPLLRNIFTWRSVQLYSWFRKRRQLVITDSLYDQ
jgi:hypothetical protein